MGRGRAEDRATGWCILRMAGQRTLAVARSLGEAGFEVWTPVEVVTRRKGSARVRVDRDAPITPTFVFVRAHQLPDLARVLALPINPHPAFSIFRFDGRIPVIADREIEALRGREEQGKARIRKAERHVFPVGERVRVTEGAGAGLSGVVEDGNGKFALVAFGASMRLKIATWLLKPEDVLDAPVQMDAAA